MHGYEGIVVCGPGFSCQEASLIMQLLWNFGATIGMTIHVRHQQQS
jgi:hypothetical protein